MDVLRRAGFVGHDIEALFQRHAGVWLCFEDWFPRWWSEVVGLSLKLKLRLGDVGVSDDFGCRFRFLGLVLLMTGFSWGIQ